MTPLSAATGETVVVDARVALVTGAGSGIGLAIAANLRAQGITVLGVDQRFDETAPHQFEADLLTREGNRASVEAALERYGRLDIVVANAGFQHVSPIRDFEPDVWDRLVGLLLTSPFLLARYGWQALAAAPGGGRFVVIASAHSLVASPFKAGYVSAKHGVLGLVKTIALEGADVGITSAALCPAYVRTALVENQISAHARSHGIDRDRVLDEVILAGQAVKRLIEPAEVAEAVSFLLTEAGKAFTGVALPMDHGWTAQ